VRISGITLAAALMAFAPVAGAQTVYKYTDSNGRIGNSRVAPRSAELSESRARNVPFGGGVG
jgi:hypothetical protein